MKLKKLPRYLALSVLTSGASSILGFLSFGGMFALWPILPVAFTAFGLSVAYEGEIYLQNINGALNKLFKHNQLERGLAKQYLLKKMLEITPEDYPPFFKDYQKQLKLLHQFGHDRLNKDSLGQKKQVEKTLGDMEKWFALQLFPGKQAPSSVYDVELRAWLQKNQQNEEHAKLIKRRRLFHAAKAFSALAGLFMTFGTTYLLVEAFSVIPLFAAIPFVSWPLLIIPMAIIAGSAYALLTYNAVTDMITNSTLHDWYEKFRRNMTGKASLQKLFIATMSVLLVTLALALTICTAGTWWTVAKEARPLFAWMGKMPSVIMGVINPMITGLSAVVFNLQNTNESLTLIENATLKHRKGNVFSRLFTSIGKAFHALRTHEHWLQMLNPFRLLLKITIMPLRIVLFLGHLVGIGVTADRVPRVPQASSALLGIISEGFEDMHYFVGHGHNHTDEPEHEHKHGHEHKHEHEHGHPCEHGHPHHDEKKSLIEKAPHTDQHDEALLQERLGKGCGHNHDIDLPTRVLKFMFSPIYVMAAGWDYLTSKINKKPLTFKDAWEKQTGLQKEKSIALPGAHEQPSPDWKTTHVVYRIQRYMEKNSINAQDMSQLKTLQQTLRSTPATSGTSIHLEKNGLFSPKTSTFITQELPLRINPSLR